MISGKLLVSFSSHSSTQLEQTWENHRLTILTVRQMALSLSPGLFVRFESACLACGRRCGTRMIEVALDFQPNLTKNEQQKAEKMPLQLTYYKLQYKLLYKNTQYIRKNSPPHTLPQFGKVWAHALQGDYDNSQ